MRIAVRIVFAVLLFSALTVSLEQAAYAYVDPGSGLLLMQTIGSMFACAAIYFRRNILGFFQKTQSQGEPEFSTTDEKGSKAAAE